MEKEDLFEKYCDIASDYLDSISYNDKKDYIVSLPLFRKVNDKIYICFYVEKKDGTYANKPMDWLLIDIDSYNVYKFYNCRINDYDTKKILPNSMNILVSPYFYLQLVYHDVSYIKYLYEQSDKYLFDEVFDKNYNVIDKIKMLKQDNEYIAYTKYVKQNIVNYTFDKKGIDTFIDDFNTIISKSLLDCFDSTLFNIKNGKNYQDSLTNYVDIVKFVCNQDVEIIEAIDNVLDNQNKELTNTLKYFNNIVIPNRQNERLTKFGNDFFENNIK